MLTTWVTCLTQSAMHLQIHEDLCPWENLLHTVLTNIFARINPLKKKILKKTSEITGWFLDLWWMKQSCAKCEIVCTKNSFWKVRGWPPNNFFLFRIFIFKNFEPVISGIGKRKIVRSWKRECISQQKNHKIWKMGANGLAAHQKILTVKQMPENEKPVLTASPLLQKFWIHTERFFTDPDREKTLDSAQKAPSP